MKTNVKGYAIVTSQVYLLKNYFKGTGNKVRAGEGGRLQEGTTMLSPEQGNFEVSDIWNMALIKSLLYFLNYLINKNCSHTHLSRFYLDPCTPSIFDA